MIDDWIEHSRKIDPLKRKLDDALTDNRLHDAHLQASRLRNVLDDLTNWLEANIDK